MKHQQLKLFLSVLLLIPTFAIPAQAAKIPDRAIVALIEARAAGAEQSYRATNGQLTQMADASKCSMSSMNEQWRQINGYLQQGNTDMAQAGGLMSARSIAACALINVQYPDQAINRQLPDLRLEEWARQIGSFLAASALAGDNNPATADQAMQFLRYAKEHGKRVDDLISRLQQKSGTNAPSLEQAALAGTAVAIVGKLSANSFAFDQQYRGKVIQATGKVIRISGSGDSATIKILGNTKKTRNQLSWRDSIECLVTNAQYLPAVGKLAEEKTATVRGTYQKGSFGEIELHNCEVK